MSEEEKTEIPIISRSIHEKLVYIQSKLVAAKKEKNTFAKFDYRTNEGIIEAVKPYLLETGLILCQEDEVILIGDRHYIKATSTVLDGVDMRFASAFAREQQTKKGMDEAQITGSASSYARKYSLNGLFAIDDNKDADAESKKEALKSAALTIRVENAIVAFLKTSSGFKTDAQWESAIRQNEKNRVNKNKVANDERFFSVVKESYREYLETIRPE